jgi:polysaccharide deacetylase family sporulation protein PdaB
MGVNAVLLIISRRKALIVALVVIALAAALLGIQLLFPGLPQRAVGALVNFDRRVPVYCVQTSEQKIAISFDAAWGADRTDEILAILDEYDIKTTFFLVGFWLERYPEVARRIAEAGHEIGYHSATHPHMASLSAEQIQQELMSTHQQIKEITGQEARLFRPPFGEYNNRVIDNAEKVGYLTIQWSVDSLDWKPISTEDIVNRVTKGIEPGAIVLFHNNGERTPQALRPILDYCRDKGYQVVPISELLIEGDYYINPNNGMMIPR